MGTTNKISNGLLWKILERFSVSGVQFVLQIVLARLLSPEHYGVLSIMIIFVNLSNVFVQTGFNTALIQNRDVTDDDYSSVFWVSLVIAFLLYIILFCSAPLIADFYNMPTLIQPLRVLAIMLFPGALNSVQIAKVSREMDFKKIFYGNIGGVVISGVVGIIIACFDGGVWALVAQTLLNVVVVCIVMARFSDWKLRLVCDLSRVKRLFSYGWKLLVSALLETLYQEVYSLVIGKKYDSSTLAYHNRGKQFPQFIMNIINGAVQSVMLPAMSEAQDDKNSIKNMMRTSIMIGSYIVFPVMIGLAAIAPTIINVLLTEKWLPCVPYMQIYCISFAFYPVNSCNLQAINAMGRSDIFLKLEVIKKIYGLGIVVAAVLLFDSPIAIAATSLITLGLSWFVNAFPNKKLLGYTYFEQLKDVMPSIILSAIMYIAVVMLDAFSFNIMIKLVLQILVGMLVYIALSIIIKPNAFGILIRYVKNYKK